MTARKRLAEQQDTINFRCERCYGKEFAKKPDRIEPDDTAPHHPWQYFAICACGAECEQAKWERGLFKAWMSATGPRTEEGKAATTRNLAGHPTPEESLRTRFNAMKHGMNARVATYFPARPDKYSFCTGCEVDRGWCARQSACTKQTEIFMLHHAAIEQRNPKILGGIHADIQASLISLLQMCIQTVLVDNPVLTSPEWYTNKDGELDQVGFMNSETGVYDYVMKKESHPLLKIILDMVSKNNLSLADLGITQKAVEREEEAMGFIAKSNQKTELLADAAHRNAVALENLAGLMDAAREKRKHDPILIEHDAQEGGRA